MRAPVRSELQHDPGPRPAALVPVLVSIGLFVSFIGSLGSPLVPSLAEAYDRSVASTQWVLTASLLTGAVLTPLMGRLADGPRRRQVILGTLAVVALGSVLCAVAADFAVLVVGRALQGAGFGLMPLAMTVARSHLPPARVGRTVGLLSVTTAFGAGLGYPLSGLTVRYAGLSATFALAAVLALVALVAAYVVVPSDTHAPSQRMDARGAVQLAVTLTLLVVGVSQISNWGLGSPAVWATLGGAALALAVWARHELRIPNPLVDLRSLRIPDVLTAHVAAFLGGAGMFLVFSIMVAYIQIPTSTGYGMGQSVLVAGLLLVPFSLTSFLSNRMLSGLRRRVGERWVMPIGCALYLAAVALFLVWHGSLASMAVLSAVTGLGIGIVYASIPRRIVRATDRNRTGSALGFNQVLRTVGGTVGSAASAALLGANTRAGSIYPLEAGFSYAALSAALIWVLLIAVTWPRRGRVQDPDLSAPADRHDAATLVAVTGRTSCAP